MSGALKKARKGKSGANCGEEARELRSCCLQIGKCSEGANAQELRAFASVSGEDGCEEIRAAYWLCKVTFPRR
jgi:hypothetical protein